MCHSSRPPRDNLRIRSTNNDEQERRGSWKGAHRKMWRGRTEQNQPNPDRSSGRRTTKPLMRAGGTESRQRRAKHCRPEEQKDASTKGRREQGQMQ